MRVQNGEKHDSGADEALTRESFRELCFLIFSIKMFFQQHSLQDDAGNVWWRKTELNNG